MKVTISNQYPTISSVITMSEAKNLNGWVKILRFAQDDGRECLGIWRMLRGKGLTNSSTTARKMLEIKGIRHNFEKE